MSLNAPDARTDETSTAFSILPRHFPNASEKLKTSEFLEASSAVITLIEKFGKVFASVVNDMRGNVQKLTDKYMRNNEAFADLEEMILLEQREGELVATTSLLWLRRSLHFLSCFFQAIVDDTECERCAQDLTPFIKRAYSEALEQYHGWLGTQMFNILSRFLPNRRHLLFKLALEKYNREEQVIQDMKAYTQGLMDCVRRLTEFYSLKVQQPLE